MIASPTNIWVTTATGVFALKSSGADWRGAGVRVLIDGAEVRLVESVDPIASLELVWTPGVPEKSLVLGDAWERSYGTLHWGEADCDRLLPWYFAAHSCGATVCWGVQTGGNAMASWRAGTEAIRLFLDVRSGYRPLRLLERALNLATMMHAEGEQSIETLRTFCKALCPNPRLPKLPTYGANDWYYAYGDNTAQRLLDDSKRVSDLAGNSENRPFSVIDAGWQLHGGCEGGPWNGGNPRFPDMPGLAHDIAQAGCQPGIWTRPLYTRETLAPECFMGDHSLDPSRPEVLQKIGKDIALLHQWGYRLIKHDFSTFEVTGLWGFEMTDGFAGKGRTYADETRTTAEILKALYQTIRDAAGDSLLIGCNTVGHLGAGLFEIQRIGDDTSGKEWARTVKMGVNTLAFRGVQQDAFFEADADCVGVTTDIPWEKNRQWLDLVARSGTPLFVSAQKEALGPEQKKALRNAFRIAATRQPLAKPIDWMTTRTPGKWLIQGEKTTFHW